MDDGLTSGVASACPLFFFSRVLQLLEERVAAVVAREVEGKMPCAGNLFLQLVPVFFPRFFRGIFLVVMRLFRCGASIGTRTGRGK